MKVFYIPSTAVRLHTLLIKPEPFKKKRSLYSVLYWRFLNVHCFVKFTELRTRVDDTELAEEKPDCHTGETKVPAPPVCTCTWVNVLQCREIRLLATLTSHLNTTDYDPTKPPPRHLWNCGVPLELRRWMQTQKKNRINDRTSFQERVNETAGRQNGTDDSAKSEKKTRDWT